MAPTAPAPPPADNDEYNQLLVSAALWTLMWVCMFYALCASQPWWTRGLTPSTKPHEDDRYWRARNVLGIIHALLVTGLGLPALVRLVGAPEYAQFASTDHTAYCQTHETDTLPWELSGKMVALAGLAFTTFTLADMFVSVRHGLLGLDFVIHHVAFFAAGSIIRSYCILPFNAAVLITMEVSTPFLNYMTFVRHRGDGYRLRVAVTGALFVLTFLLSRIVLNIYGTVMLLQMQVRGLAIPPKVPLWQAWFLVVAVTTGALVQVYWLPGILAMFCSRLAELVRGGDCRVGEGNVDFEPLLSGCDACEGLQRAPKSAGAGV